MGFEWSAEDKVPDKDRLCRFSVANITDWVLVFATFLWPIWLRSSEVKFGSVDRLFHQAATVNPALAWDH